MNEIIESLPKPNSIIGVLVYSFVIYLFIFLLALIFGKSTPYDPIPTRDSEAKTEKTNGIKPDPKDDFDNNESWNKKKWGY